MADAAVVIVLEIAILLVMQGYEFAVGILRRRWWRASVRSSKCGVHRIRSVLLLLLLMLLLLLLLFFRGDC